MWMNNLNYAGGPIPQKSLQASCIGPGGAYGRIWRFTRQATGTKHNPGHFGWGMFPQNRTCNPWNLNMMISKKNLCFSYLQLPCFCFHFRKTRPQGPPFLGVPNQLASHARGWIQPMMGKEISTFSHMADLIQTNGRKSRKTYVWNCHPVKDYCWWLKSCTTWDVWNPVQ